MREIDKLLLFMYFTDPMSCHMSNWPTRLHLIPLHAIATRSLPSFPLTFLLPLLLPVCFSATRPVHILLWLCSSFILRKAQRSIRAAKAETICQHHIHAPLLRFKRDIVEFELGGVDVGEVERWWYHILHPD